MLKSIKNSSKRFVRNQVECGDHFDGHVFFNTNNAKDHSFRDFLKIAGEIQKAPWPKWMDLPNFAKPTERVFAQEVNVSVINHSTVLIQLCGINILTDPVYSDRVSPVSFLGPRRVHRPGISFMDLPPIDVVLVSHNHYDHLDIKTLKEIEARFSPLTLTSLGNELFLRKNGLKNVQEFDWWENLTFREIEFNFVPAQHFSSRGLHDRNMTLWGGFVLRSNAPVSAAIYFGGDTGYGPFFREIEKRFGPMTLSLIPIGAYEPRWFMKPVHMNPEDAVRAHLDLKSKQSIGIHFGCFKLTSEAINDPASHLIKACEDLGVTEGEFLVPEFGRVYKF